MLPRVDSAHCAVATCCKFSEQEVQKVDHHQPEKALEVERFVLRPTRWFVGICLFNEDVELVRLWIRVVTCLLLVFLADNALLHLLVVP